jgi:predicted nuclease with TOPRIM domain
MCEVTESESLERRLESLHAENERLKGKVSLLERDIDVRAGNAELLQLGVEWLRDNPKFTDESFDRLAAENERLKAEWDRMRVACEAAREFLTDAVAYGLARQEKGRVLGLIRAALDGDAAPAVEEKG